MSDDMADEGKKTECVKVWMSDVLMLELSRMADAQDRKLSEFINLILRKHVFGHRAGSLSDMEVPTRGGAGRD